LNWEASAIPAFCGGIGERIKKQAFSLIIGDSPQFVAGSFNAINSIKEDL